jgi:hypothetical protein
LRKTSKGTTLNRGIIAPREPLLAEQQPEPEPELDFRPGKPAGIRLTKDLRAALLAETGHDISPEDPLWTVVVLNQLLLPQLAQQIVSDLSLANSQAAEALAAMRQEVLNAVADDCVDLARETVKDLREGLKKASSGADRIIARIESAWRFSAAGWIAIGAAAVGLVWLGYWLGKGSV